MIFLYILVIHFELLKLHIKVKIHSTLTRYRTIIFMKLNGSCVIIMKYYFSNKYFMVYKNSQQEINEKVENSYVLLSFFFFFFLENGDISPTFL